MTTARLFSSQGCALFWIFTFSCFFWCASTCNHSTAVRVVWILAEIWYIWIQLTAAGLSVVFTQKHYRADFQRPGSVGWQCLSALATIRLTPPSSVAAVALSRALQACTDNWLLFLFIYMILAWLYVFRTRVCVWVPVFSSVPLLCVYSGDLFQNFH